MSPRGALLAVATWTTLAACSVDEPKSKGQRGIVSPDETPAVRKAAPDDTSTETSQDPSFADDDWDDWDDVEEPAAQPVTAQPPGTEQAPPEQDEDQDEEAEEEADRRDVGRELVELLDLSACLDSSASEAAPGDHFTVRADAYVMYGGRVQSVNVQVPGQPKSALDCLARQLDGRVLPNPVEGAPNRFSGSVQVDYTLTPTSPEQ